MLCSCRPGLALISPKTYASSLNNQNHKFHMKEESRESLIRQLVREEVQQLREDLISGLEQEFAQTSFINVIPLP
jgi:hypothetical protein